MEENLEVTLSSITLASTTWRVGSLLFERERCTVTMLGSTMTCLMKVVTWTIETKKKEPKRFSLSK